MSAGLAVITFLVFLVHLGVGSSAWYTPGDVIRELVRGPGFSEPANTIVWQIRLPRATACVLVGGILGLVGSAFQAQLRNPLADPYIVGVSSGAAVGGAAAFVLGLAGWFGGLGVTVFGFFTGLLSLWLVYSLAKHRGVVDVTSLLLAGVVIGSLLSAVLSLLLIASGKDQTVVLAWLLGSISPSFWAENALLAVALLAGAVILARESRRLNVFALGEDTAQRLGVDTVRLTRVVLITGTAMTAAAVGAVGIVGFLGLVAPHIARRLMGVDWRRSMTGAMIVGMLLLTGSDLIAQRLIPGLLNMPGLELPVGIVTALLGAPSLLILLKRSK
jgi:iron complex transport system permease protein